MFWKLPQTQDLGRYVDANHGKLDFKTDVQQICLNFLLRHHPSSKTNSSPGNEPGASGKGGLTLIGFDMFQVPSVESPPPEIKKDTLRMP
jgi:hypothetical protein